MTGHHINPHDKQRHYMNKLIKRQQQVSVFLRSGIQLRGTIAAVDKHTLLLKGDDETIQLVYKHAVSTVLVQQSHQSKNQQIKFISAND